MTIGERIRQLREQRNMSQAEFARRLNVTRATASAWEQGVNLPTAGYLIDMARLFRVSSDYLLGLSSANLFTNLSIILNKTTRQTPEGAGGCRKGRPRPFAGNHANKAPAPLMASEAIRGAGAF